MSTTFCLTAFSLGGPEVAIIFVLMLLLFGAKKLPELARGMGKSLGEFKKAREDFESEITRGGDDANHPSRPVHTPRQDYVAPVSQSEVASSVAEPAGKQPYQG